MLNALRGLSTVNNAYAKTAGELIVSIKDKILFPVIGVLFVLATVVFLWGVIEMIAGTDNEQKLTQGKQHMLWGLIGLLIMASAGAIITILCDFIGASC